MKKKQYNLNYNFAVQKEPKKRMGQGSFANLPTECIHESFGNEAQYRSGIPNRFDVGCTKISGIYENERDDEDGYA